MHQTASSIAAPSPRAGGPRPEVSRALVASAVTIALFALVVLAGLGGWSYYTTPLADRPYSVSYAVLRPSGYAGHLFGVAGFVLMLVPVAYAARKRIRALQHAGGMPAWLDVHIFCGIVGPVFVTFHTSFKFNGLVAVAYWSMVVVAASGFIGRYLYVRIPRSVRGLTLSHGELDARAEALHSELVAIGPSSHVMARVAVFEDRLLAEGPAMSFWQLCRSEVALRRGLVSLLNELNGPTAETTLVAEAVRIIVERATLMRRARSLETTRRLFELWHVFHLPLVYVMFAVVVAHIAVTLYMGYIPFVR